MKVRCPFHEDANPSMEVYADGHGYCFVCCKRAEAVGAVRTEAYGPKEVENITESIAAIRALQTKELRGLKFHTGPLGFYIIWPDETYYKYRLFANNGPRYLSPKGHKQPLLVLPKPEFYRGLLIVEGELNALSLEGPASEFGCQVVSPGSAGNFQTHYEALGELIVEAPRVFVWTDRDSPGIQALWSIAGLALKSRKDFSYKCTDPKLDANTLLVELGSEGLCEIIAPFLEESF